MTPTQKTLDELITEVMDVEERAKNYVESNHGLYKMTTNEPTHNLGVKCFKAGASAVGAPLAEVIWAAIRQRDYYQALAANEYPFVVERTREFNSQLRNILTAALEKGKG